MFCFCTLINISKIKVALYNSIKPLFTNKPLVLVLNKVDLVRYEQLSDENKSMIEAIVAEGATTVESSSFTDEGVMHVKQVACDKLLASRVEMKMRNKQVGSVLNKLHLAEPVPRDEKARPAAIPEAALTQVKYDKNDPNRRKLARDIEAENGGPGIYAADFNRTIEGVAKGGFFNLILIRSYRAIHSQERQLEARRNPRDLERQERCRFC